MPVLIQRMQDTPYYTPLLMTMLASLGAEWDRVSIHSREQTATMSLHQSPYVDSLTLRALTRTASGDEVRRHSEIEVSTSPQPGEEGREADTIFTMQLWNEMRTTTVDVRRSISVGDDFTKGQTLP